MPLRVRLSLAFVAIVLVPLSLTALLIQLVLTGNLEDSGRDRLKRSEQSVLALLDELDKRATASAIDVAATRDVQEGVRDKKSPRVQSVLETRARALTDADVAPDFTAVVDARGALVASTGGRPQLLPGHTPPQLAALGAPGVTTPYAVLGDARLSGVDGDLGSVVTGFWLDKDALNRLQGDQTDINLSLIADGRAVSSTITAPERLAAVTTESRRGAVVKVGGLLTTRVLVMPGADLVVSRREAVDTAKTWPALLGIIVVFTPVAALLGWLLARVTTRPLEELSDAAMDMASGKFDTRIIVPPSGEVGRLAIAFNAMSDELTTYVKALEESRDDLKRNLTRLGETLSSTHDLSKMLSVILETAIVTMRADAGALMLFTAHRDELYVKIGRGLQGRIDDPTLRIKVGEGIAGRVARSGEPLHGPVGSRPGDLELSAGEPRASAVIAVPLKGRGRIQGVLNLYDKEGSRAFDDDDVATIRAFANQATVAIDNVLLHQETQRLSITDGLTGLWNYRYFQMTFDKEIERASRFARPLSLLMLDLDKFKSVNDTHGHQRGDSVLIELATRVKGAIREVDTFARYGGEEFVLILPETDLAGAELTAEKLRELIRARRFGSNDEEPLRLTVSIGVAVYPEDGDTPAGLVRAADTALYAAKGAGRDRVALAQRPCSDVEVVPHVKLDPSSAAETQSALESAATAVARTRGGVELGEMPTE